MVRNKKEKSYIGSALTLAEVASILKISKTCLTACSGGSAQRCESRT